MPESELIALITNFQAKGEYSKATEICEKALGEGQNYSAGFYFTTAQAFHAIGRLEDAITSYRLGLAISPDNVPGLINLAKTLKEQGRSLAAARFLQQAGNIEPNNPEIWYELANVLQIMGRNEDAINCYQEVLRLRPEDAAAGHLLAALRGEDERKVPAEYVRNLFDNYAPRFEQSLVGKLGYDIPAKIGQILRKFDRCYDRALDLGAGTGLMGGAIKDIAKEISGVDISENMVKIARTKNIYKNLECADINEFININNNKYDLIIAADVLVYIGELSNLFASIKKIITDNGIFIFSIELSASKELELRPHGRYGHSFEYIENLGEKHGLKVLIREETPIRLEEGNPIPGQIIGLQPKS